MANLSLFSSKISRNRGKIDIYDSSLRREPPNVKFDRQFPVSNWWMFADISIIQSLTSESFSSLSMIGMYKCVPGKLSSLLRRLFVLFLISFTKSEKSSIFMYFCTPEILSLISFLKWLSYSRESSEYVWGSVSQVKGSLDADSLFFILEKWS